MKLRFKQFLIETPITNYETVGDFSRNSSFRHARDRMLITNPKSIEITKAKAENTNIDFNFIFVNSAKANKFTEVGVVDGLEWVKKNLGDEVYDRMKPMNLGDAVNVIFTNNKGSERMHMTTWVQFHRILHACRRKNGMNVNGSRYDNASNQLIQTFSQIMELYGISDVPDSDNAMNRHNRNNQLRMKAFFSKVCTFRSAREGIIRDWFEVMNELGAQYLTTGKIKFNKAPEKFVYFSEGKRYCTIKGKQELNEANEDLDTLARTLEFMINDIFGELYGEILVM